MSIQATSHVWQHSKQSGSNLLVLLALADFTNTDGVAWPSIETIAKKVRTSERNVQKIIRKLKDAGELIAEPGPTHWSTWRYQIAGFVPVVRQGGELQYASPGVLQATQNHESLNHQKKSESIPESRISSIRERDFDPSGKDDKNVSDGEAIDGAVPGRLVRLLPTPDQRKELAAQSQRLGVALYAEVLERCKEARSWNYVLKALKAETPTPPTPSPRAVAQSAYADWIDVGFGPGVFAPPEQPVTQGDTAADNTPALDDEQREYFRQVDAEDETTPDAEFTDMSDVIPAGIKALQK